MQPVKSEQTDKQSDFMKVVMLDQYRSLRKLEEYSKQTRNLAAVSALDEHGIKSDEDKSLEIAKDGLKVDKEALSETKKLNENLSKLSVAIKDNISGMIKNGGGEKLGDKAVKGAANTDVKSIGDVIGGWGKNKIQGIKDTVKHIATPSAWNLRGMVGVEKGSGSLADQLLQNRENRQARVKEKAEFVKNAVDHDRSTRNVMNFSGTKTDEQRAAGLAAGQAHAEKKYEEMKGKEKALSEAHGKVTSAQAAGYAPKVGDVKARDKAAAEFAEVDPRQRSQAVQAIRDEKNTPTKVEASATKSQDLFSKEESTEENQKVFTDMAAVLSQQLQVQTEILGFFKNKPPEQPAAAAQESGGGGILSSAMDLAANIGGKGKGLLGKAGGFLKAAGPGLLKGGLLGIGGMAAEAGGDALKDAGYEKTGGAVSTLGTAASYAGTGAMIGSVIPGVGTAIGAGVGGAIGLGKGLYDNWGSMFGGKKEDDAKAKVQEKPKEGEPIGVTKTGTPVFEVKPSAVPANSAIGERLAGESKSTEDLKADKMASVGGTAMVNAPTTINNNSTMNTNHPRSPSRNPESSMNRYIQSRYAA